MATISFNYASGSDTQASGNGPATAVYGTSASYSGSVFTLDGSPDLSGVTTDHVLWVNTSTGTSFFTISSVNDGADQITVNETPAGTASGLTWACGGKRKAMDAAENDDLWQADGDGWIAELEDDQTLSSEVLVTVADIEIRSDTPGTNRVITQTTNNYTIDRGSGSGLFKLVDLTLKNSFVGSRTSATGIDWGASGGEMVAENCIFGDVDDTDNLYSGFQRTGGDCDASFFNCVFINTDSRGLNNFWKFLRLKKCAFLNCGNTGVYTLGTTSGGCELHIEHCIFYGCTNHGVEVNWASNGNKNLLIVQNCDFVSNTGDGLNTADIDPKRAFVTNNNFVSNGAYGWQGNSSQTTPWIGDYNNFYNNTTAARNNIDAGSNDTAVDPGYTDAANYDFSLGTNVKGAGNSEIALGIVTSLNSQDIGACQRVESAGGGGSINRGIQTGGRL